jgi:hypothetical protein
VLQRRTKSAGQLRSSWVLMQAPSDEKECRIGQI